MSDNVIRCLRCDSVYVGPLTELCCSNEGYFTRIGEYQVEWWRRGACSIWCDKGGYIDIPDHLPADISEDMIKMFYTFQ